MTSFSKTAPLSRVDAAALARAPLAFARVDETKAHVVPFPSVPSRRGIDPTRIGVISNPRSRRNQQGNPVHRRAGDSQLSTLETADWLRSGGGDSRETSE